jgi:AraC-like DNA-binding protein/copper chaperone CopZ
MTLYIKNMVCIRCKMIVKSELEKMGLHKITVGLGEAKIKEEISDEQREELNKALNKSGFELLNQQKSKEIENIKNCVIELVHYSGEKLKNFQSYLSEKLKHDYTYLNTLFFEVQNITIENFLLKHRIERVKELLVYNKLSLPEIADLLGFGSESQLTFQFKEITGFSPSHFQEIRSLRSIVRNDV